MEKPLRLLFTNRMEVVMNEEARTALRASILDITLDNLDDVLLLHTSLFDQITAGLPVLRDLVADAKDDISKQHGLSDQSIRQTAVKDGVKITENQITAAIQLDETYLNALATYRQAKLDVGEQELLRDLMFQREWSVRELIKLYMGEYWGISGIHERTAVSGSAAAESVKRRLRDKGLAAKAQDSEVDSIHGKAARSFKRS